MRQRELVILIGFVVGVIGASEHRAHAQAWVGYPGALDVALDYNIGISDSVIQSEGHSSPDSGGRTQEITGALEYVPVSRLAVDVALPFEALTYTGSMAPQHLHPGGGSYDDGKTHTTLTDLLVGARYQLLEEPFALTPMVGVSIPVANYETVGNMVAGRHLKQLHMGIAIGKMFGDAYAQLSYEFSLVERYDRTVETKRFGENHSDASAILGYKLLDDRMDISVTANGRVTHGGVDFVDFGQLTAGEKLYHDAYLHEDAVVVGPGLGYQLTDSLAVTIAARFFVWGINTQNASIYGLALSWSAL